MKTIVKTEVTGHPLEDEFEIEPCTTVVEYKEAVPAEIVPHPTYDKKDEEIEEKIEEVYTAAMASSNIMSDEIERVEGKYKARMGEVTAAMLNVALGAIREKRQLKQHKDEHMVAGVSASTPNTVNNNLVVADRNEILKIIRDKKKLEEENG